MSTREDAERSYAQIEGERDYYKRRADREATGFRAMCEAFQRLEEIVGLDTGGGMGPAPALNAVQSIIRERDELRDQRDALIDAACLDGAGPRLRAAIDRLGESAFQRCTPRGMALVPRAITAETGHKAGMIGDFYEPISMQCTECEPGDPDPDCEVCGGLVEFEGAVVVSWTTIKAIHRRIVEISAAPKPWPPELTC